MATQDFKVEKEEGWKALGVNIKDFTKNDNGVAYYAEAATVAELVDVRGKLIFSIPGVLYTLDPTKLYFIRTMSTISFGFTPE